MGSSLSGWLRQRSPPSSSSPPARAGAVAAILVSFAATTLLAPLIAPVLVDADISGGSLLGRFSLVVVVPLVLAVGLAQLAPPLRALPDTVAPVLVAALVYAAASGVANVETLLAPTLAAAAFLITALSAAFALRRVIGGLGGTGMAFAFRDFAVAIALAVQLDPAAAAVPAVYGC